MTRTLILPGFHNSDSDHWQSRWEARDDTLLRVIQDDWETPHCAEWVARLDQALERTGPETLLVAHSAGCALVAHWAVGCQRGWVRAALLVAPSDPEAPSFPPGPTGFAPMPLRRLPFRSVIVASSNDPYVTISRAQEFATAWGSDIAMIGEAGHINSASGLGDWPEGFSLLRSLRETRERGFSGTAAISLPHSEVAVAIPTVNKGVQKPKSFAVIDEVKSNQPCAQPA
jgi:predicted alpha/beta hydrolase family esterase